MYIMIRVQWATKVQRKNTSLLNIRCGTKKIIHIIQKLSFTALIVLIVIGLKLEFQQSKTLCNM